MPTDIDGIIGQFSHPTISVINESSTYQGIAETNIMLNINTTSIHSNLKDGKQ